MLKRTQAPKKPERLEVRVSRGVKQVIERASFLCGRSLSDFIASGAFEFAKRTIKEHESMVLGLKDQQAFVALLLHPPAPTRRARVAAKRYRKMTSKRHSRSTLRHVRPELDLDGHFGLGHVPAEAESLDGHSPPGV